MHTKHSTGFTLIELSIVLVIIGLIIGGILVGKDMIRSAQVRATVGQYEKYKAAVNAFKIKYNNLPGDLTTADATAFGFIPVSRPGTAPTETHGNGMIEGTMYARDIDNGEQLMFWQDLSSANLIDGSFTAVTADTFAAPFDNTLMRYYFPPIKLNSSAYWMADGDGVLTPGDYFVATSCTHNCFSMRNIISFSVEYSITPMDAYNIDVKLDDGLPATGKVQDTQRRFVATVCGVAVGANVYPYTTTAANCGLSLSF